MSRSLLSTLIFVLTLTLVACSSLNRPQTGVQSSVPGSENASLALSGSGYEFDDIKVPADMDLQADESFMMQTPQIKAGSLVYSGWVDPISLFDYYLQSMPAQGWTPLSYFKYGRFLLVFQKQDKVSVIRIHKARFSTRLEIWVSPAMPHQDTGVSERILLQ